LVGVDGVWQEVYSPILSLFVCRKRSRWVFGCC